MQQTDVVAIGKVLPEGGLHTTVGFESHVSKAATVYVTVAPLALVHSVVMSSGHVMLGAIESVTVTLKQQRLAFPA